MSEDVPFSMPGGHWLDGIPYPEICPADIIKKIHDFPVYQDDVFITGYPKSGNVWTMSTIEAILQVDKLDDLIKNGVRCSKALVEGSDGYDGYLTWNRPRVIRTHLRYKYLPKGVKDQKSKVIHIMRNPRDVAVSYYHFTQMSAIFGKNTGSWATFFDAYMAGHVAYGTWYDYMTDWLKYKDEPNILFIKYEDFRENRHDTIRNMAKFLGKSLEEEHISKIAELVSFKSMKTNPKLDFTHAELKGDFLRKGLVGDWVNYFTPEQEERIDDMYQKFTQDTGVEFKFKQ